MLLLALAATCAVEFDKPVAVRLSVAAVSTLLYFRNTALVGPSRSLLSSWSKHDGQIWQPDAPFQFVKLALFVSLVVLYGDVALPIALFLRAKAAVSSVQTVRLALTCVWLGKNVRRRWVGSPLSICLDRLTVRCCCSKVMILFALFRSGAFRSRSLKTLRRPMMRRKMPAKAE
jgi:hypothetical protein